MIGSSSFLQKESFTFSIVGPVELSTTKGPTSPLHKEGYTLPLSIYRSPVVPFEDLHVLSLTIYELSQHENLY